MARKMNARTEGLRNFVELALARLRSKDLEGTERVLVDLWNDIGGAYVCVQRTPKINGPIPTYNAKHDGDYHTWLVIHNCD